MSKSVKGFSITIRGDKSVGIPNQEFYLEADSGSFEFDEEQYYLHFMSELKRFFEECYNDDEMPVSVMRYVDMEEYNA